MKCDIKTLEARVFHGLKSLLTPGDTLPPRYLEYTVCQSFGLRHVGDGNFYADGVTNDSQVSVKTRMLNPEILKKTHSGRDFTTHPEKFLGVKTNMKQRKAWAGLEFVQRRQEIDNESSSSPRRIGLLSIRGFRKNILESKKKFNVSKTYEVLLVHGYNWQKNRYIVNVFWQEQSLPTAKGITWKAVPGGVDGCIDVDGQSQIVVHRVRGGAPRESTCYKEYKNPTKYKHSVSISVPIPEPWPYDQDQILNELNNLKAQRNGPILFEE